MEKILVGRNPKPSRNPKSRKFGFESGRVWLILRSGLSDPKPEIPRFSGSSRVSEIFRVFAHSSLNVRDSEFPLNMQIHGQWTCDEDWGLFSDISQIIGWFRQMGQINHGIFKVFPIEISVHILSLCFPSPWFSIYQPLFLQKTKL